MLTVPELLGRYEGERLRYHPIHHHVGHDLMAQFRPDNFCDPASAKYRDKYAKIAREPTHTDTELNGSWCRARELALKFETTTFERGNAFGFIE